MHNFTLTVVVTFFISYCLSAQNGYPATSVLSIVVEDNNVSGGGFQSDVTITDDGQTVYSSADVSGIFKSTDSGLHFKNINQGLKSPKVASLVITPDNDQILYAATGNKGASGGLFRSTNGGENWVLTKDGNEAQFAGNHSSTSDPIPIGHPRSNGDLIVVEAGTSPNTYTDDIVIAGTYKDGVKLFTGGGDTLIQGLETNGFVRSVAHHPAVPGTAYAAIQFSNSSRNGIYRIDFSDLTAINQTLVYQTLRPEGLAVLSNGHVYAAIGTAGIVKYNGTNWVEVNNMLSINNNNRQWAAVTGYVINDMDIVYIGTNNLGGIANGTKYQNIWRTINGGASWSPLIDANSNNVSKTIYGQTYDWWYLVNGFPQAKLGLTNSVVSSIDVARGPDNASVADDIIYVSGRGGIWKSENGGGSWQPAVYNMQATANNGVAVNPNDPSQVVLANTDYVLLETRNGYQSSDISRDKPQGAESKCYDVIFDVTADQLILGVGDRDTNNPGGGKVYVKSAAEIGNSSSTCTLNGSTTVPVTCWLDTELDAVTASNNGRVRAITYGYHDGNIATTQTILAAVEGEGVFRYHNNEWLKSSGINIAATKRSNFIWPDKTNSGVVYLLDLSTGLYRSNDGGQSWTNMWPEMCFINNDFYNTGYITADDNDPSTLYISMHGGRCSPKMTSFKVYRMEDADTGIFGLPPTAGITDITKHSGSMAIKRPGPIAIGPSGDLWLTQQQNSSQSIDAALFVMQNPTTDASFIDVTTNAYRNIAIQPSGIDVSSDGYVYISQTGTGLVKVKYEQIPNMVLSTSCIEVFADPEANTYTVSGELGQFDIDIIYPNGAVFSSLNDHNGRAVSIDSGALPAGTFLIRVTDPSNSNVTLIKNIK